MDSVIVEYIEKPKLSETIFIEGLPGVGNVGKLAAEHLIEELGAKKFADIYSKFFPPQVLVEDDGVVKLVNNELFYLKRKGKRDLILLVGEYQGLTPDGQYDLSWKLLDVAEEYGVKEIYTLGGYGLGKMIEKPRVLGAATDSKLVAAMKKIGVEFPKGEPGSGIVGASGLLLGLGKLRKMDAVCLMGETSGYFVDPKSSQAVLEVLSKILDVELDFSKLEERAEQIDQITSKLKDLEKMVEAPEKASHEDLTYIG